jgi:hypothetical protein
MSDASSITESEENRPITGGPTDRWAWVVDQRWDGSTRVVGGALLLGTLGLLWQVGGVIGVATWLVVAGSWLLFPPIVPVAIGQFALVAVAPDLTVEVGVTAVALLALLGADFLDRPTAGGGIRPASLVYALCFAGLCLLFGGSLFGVAARNGIETAVAAVGLLGAGLAYTLHRYSVVAFGQADESGTSRPD